MDGAKVFGHNAILVENADGTSDFYSFMGTGALPDMLQNEDSLGYMGHESLTKEETKKFLETGDIDVTMAGGDNEVKNHDNYDRAIKKKIGLVEYDQIVDSASKYEILYNNGRDKDIDSYLNSNPDAIYNLYTHNCDTVAGEIIGGIDPLFTICQRGMLSTTPNNSFYVRKELLDDTWEDMTLGDIDFWEWSIAQPGLLYDAYVMDRRIYFFIAREILEFHGKECGTD